MIKQLQHIIPFENRYYLLGATLMNDANAFHLMLVKVVKGEITIEERSEINTFEALKSHIPVILHIDGEGVISKQTTKETAYKNGLVFGANIDDFYFYEYHQDSDIYASIIRKSVIENLLAELRSENLAVVHLSAGPFVLANLLSMFEGEKSVYLSDHIVEVNKNKIMSFSTDGVALETQHINGEELNFKEIPLMASVLNYMYPLETINSKSDLIASNREDYKFKKLFKLAGVFTLVFIMTALFAGHYLLEFYSNALAEKSAEYSLYQQSTERIKLLEQERELKEKILLSSGINNDNFLTKYVSEIGNTVPNDITLTSIKVMSPKKKIRSEKKIELALNTIDIVGETYNDASFNMWIDALRAVDWVRTVNIEYHEDTRVNNTFNVKIKI